MTVRNLDTHSQGLPESYISYTNIHTTTDSMDTCLSDVNFDNQIVVSVPDVGIQGTHSQLCHTTTYL